jgi:hypothetical protein
MLAMMTTSSFAGESEYSPDESYAFSLGGEIEVIPNDSSFEIPNDAVVNSLVSVLPTSSLLRGTSVPTASYDLGWEGPYYFTGTASANVNMFTNYLFYGISSSIYKLRITNNGSTTASSLIFYADGSGVGGISVSSGDTITVTFGSLGSPTTKFYVRSSTAAGSLNITGCVYY